MRLQYASDLHLEIPANRDFVLAGALEPAADYLLLAGDISFLSDWHKADAFWDWCARSFQHTWIVPGNHDYHADRSNLLGLASLQVPVRPNVTYANNVCVHVEEVSLVLTTLCYKRRKSKKKSLTIVRYILMAKQFQRKLSIVCIRKAERFWIGRFRCAIRTKRWWSRTMSLCRRLRPSATSIRPFGRLSSPIAVI